MFLNRSKTFSFKRPLINKYLSSTKFSDLPTSLETSACFCSRHIKIFAHYKTRLALSACQSKNINFLTIQRSSKKVNVSKCLLILHDVVGIYIRSDTMKPIQVVWNSNLMIPDLPIDIRIRLAELNFFWLLPDFANSLPSWLSHHN